MLTWRVGITAEKFVVPKSFNACAFNTYVQAWNDWEINTCVQAFKITTRTSISCSDLPAVNSLDDYDEAPTILES